MDLRGEVVGYDDIRKINRIEIRRLDGVGPDSGTNKPDSDMYQLYWRYQSDSGTHKPDLCVVAT